jgi:mRNA (guanine-N7-)-methyltransferase
MSKRDELIYCIIKMGKIHDFMVDIPTDTQPLRDFHNWIKLKLILDAKQNTKAVSLFDIAVGKGGDLPKWGKANLKYVIGIDSDAKSLNERKEFAGAWKRYHSMKDQGQRVPKSKFLHIDIIKDAEVFEKLTNQDGGMIYDIVSCQFAFHYFVKDIDKVLNLISKKLKLGGMFIGTASDGDLIAKNLQNGDILLPVLNIIKDSTDQNKYIYHQMSGASSGTRTYFELMGTSSEYYLFKEFLVEKCKQFNLQLVEILNFHEWKKKYHGRELSAQELVASYFNFSFVFIKI